MLKEIENYFQYILKDSRGKKNLLYLLIAIAVLISLFLLHYFFLYQFISDDLIVRFYQSNLLFVNNLSPYDADVQQYISNILSDRSLSPTANVFDLEIALPQLILYFPFSFFKDPIWGLSLFSTISSFAYLFAVFLLIKITKNIHSGYETVLILVLSMTSIFFISNILMGTVAAINFLICIAVIYFMQDKKNLVAGIILGFLTFDIVTIPVLIGIYIFGLIKSKKSTAVTWAFISNALISLTFMVFDRDWMVGWLRNLFFDPQRVPFLTYPQALSLRYGFPTFQLFAIISLLFVIWGVFEAWQNPYNSSRSWLWVLGLGAIINYFLIIQFSDTSAIMLIIPMIFVFSIWKHRIGRKGKIISFGFLAIFTAVFSALYYFYPAVDMQLMFDVFTLASAIFLVLNLYWLKRWAIIPFEYGQIFTEN